MTTKRVLRERLSRYRHNDRVITAIVRTQVKPAIQEVCEERDELILQNERLRWLIEDLTDETDCYEDDRGCIAHGWFTVDVPCPHARAKELPHG